MLITIDFILNININLKDIQNQNSMQSQNNMQNQNNTKCSVCDKKVARNLLYHKYNKEFCSIQCIQKIQITENEKEEKRVIYHFNNTGLQSF